MNQDEMTRRAYDLAEEHWSYIEELLWAHGEKVGNMDIAKFHYNEAFKHGYKHCWEDTYIPGQIIHTDKYFNYDLTQSTPCDQADKK